MQDFESLLDMSRKLANAAGPRDDVLTAICFLLKDEVPHYDWVGVYFADNRKRVLNLGPYAGDPTEHVKIPFGQGICGQVAESHEALEVPDVGSQDNYLACSPFVKSEIVVPIIKKGKFVGQLDIDSHRVDAFTEDDAEFLEELCRELAVLF